MQRQRDANATRAALLDAARRAFSAHGYDASVRAIAGDAGVDAALVNRYFGNKEGLFTEAMRSFDADRGGLEADRPLAAQLAASCLDKGELGGNASMMAVLRSAGEPIAVAVLRRLIAEQFTNGLARHLDGPDAEARAALAAALVLGMGVAHGVLALDGLGDAARVTPWLEAAFEALVGPGSPAPTT